MSSNPIKTSEILIDDDGLTKIIGQLEKLDKTYEGFVDKIQAKSVQLEKAMKGTNISTVSQREEYKRTGKQVDELTKQYDKYIDLLGDNAVQIAGLKNGQSQLNKVNKLEATIASTRAGSMENLNAQLKLNKLRLDQMTESGKANTREGFELEDHTQRLTLRIKDLKDEQRKAINIRKLENKVANSQSGSYDQLSAQYSLMKIRINAMSVEQRENTAEGQKMVKQSAAIYAEMDRLQKLTGKHTLNVGNYTNSIVSAFNRQKQLTAELKKSKEEFEDLPKSVRESDEAQKEFAENTAKIVSEMEQLTAVTGKTAKDVEALTGSNESLLDSVSDLPGALGDAGGGVKALSGQFKSLLKNPVVLVIGLIVGSLYALFNAFKASERGTEFMAKASGLLNGIWSTMIGIVDTAVEKIEFLFENPKQAIKDFGKSIVNNVINRMKGIIYVGVGVLKVLKDLVTLDFGSLEESAKGVGTAFLQFATGLDGDQQKKFAEDVAETTKRVADQTAKFIELESAKRATIKTNREIAKSIEKIATIEQLAQSIADDNTKSFAVREKAAERARKATERRAAKEIQIAKANLKLVNDELDLRRANGEQVDNLLDDQLSAYQQLIGAEREYSLAVRDNEKTRDELKQDRLERDLDILIDGFDNQKTINERIIADDAKTFEERSKLFNQTVQLSDDSFQKQIETIQKFTGVNVDANDLIAESDAVALNQKIRSLGLSEIIEGRLLEIIRDRKTAVQDLSEAERDLAISGRDEKLANLAVEQGLAEAEFELLKTSEIEKSEFKLNQQRETLKTIEEINKQFPTLPPIDTAKLKLEIEKLENDILVVKNKSAIDQFDLQQELAQSEFDLTKATEKEKTEFRLNAEKERLLKILELNEKFGNDLNDIQKQIIKNQISAIEGELDGLGRNGGFNIYDALGLNLNEEQQKAMSDAFSFGKDQLIEYSALRTKLAEQNVQQANNDVAAAQNALEIEMANRQAGFADQVETAQKALIQEKENQKAALKERQKAQRAQLAIQTIEQASNLVTASSKIWSTLGFPLAIPALAVMWGTFAATKIRAFQATKKTFGKGGMVEIDGGSHASGNDTPLGFEVRGKQAYGEKGETHIITNKNASRKNRQYMPYIFDKLNKGLAEDLIFNQDVSDIPIVVDGGSTDMSRTNGLLNKIANKDEYYQLNGKTIQKVRGTITITHH